MSKACAQGWYQCRVLGCVQLRIRISAGPCEQLEPGPEHAGSEPKPVDGAVS